MKGFLHSRRLEVKSEGYSGTLRRSGQEDIRDDPFLGLSSRVSPKLLPACPGIRSAVASPSHANPKYVIEKPRPKKPAVKLGNLKLQPIKVVRSTRRQSISFPNQPISPRPVKTPSFSVESEISEIKQRTLVSKKPTPSIKRVTSLKVLNKEEVICSFGTNVWKSTKHLCPLSLAIMTKEPKKPLLHSKLERFARLKKLATKLVLSKATTGLLIVSHLPVGFDEFALKNFFKQFGRILRVKLSRGKKTGRSRGYGFLEFEERETAEAAAEAMHGFLMFGKQLVCRVVDEVAPHAFTPCRRNPQDPYPDFRARYNAPQTTEEVAVRVQGMLDREAKLRELLESKHIEYDFPGFRALVTSE